MPESQLINLVGEERMKVEPRPPLPTHPADEEEFANLDEEDESETTDDDLVELEPDPQREKLMAEGDVGKLAAHYDGRLREQLSECRKMRKELEATKKKVEELEAAAAARIRCKKQKAGPRQEQRCFTRAMLSRYFSRAQINYLFDFRANGGGGGDDSSSPRVRWSVPDLNRFARLKAHVRICGYNYIRRMNIVPMPSLNVIRRAQKEGTLSRETLDIIDRKMSSRTTKPQQLESPSCDDEGSDVAAGGGGGGGKKKKKAEKGRWSAERKRMVSLVVSAIQSGNPPSIIVRKKGGGVGSASEEHALFTPTPGTRTGEWNDEEFNTVFHKRTATGYSRSSGGAASKASIYSDCDADADAAVAPPKRKRIMKKERPFATVVQSPSSVSSAAVLPVSAAGRAAGEPPKVFQLSNLNQMVISNGPAVQHQQTTFITAAAADQFHHQDRSCTIVYEEGAVEYHAVGFEDGQHVQFH